MHKSCFFVCFENTQECPVRGGAGAVKALHVVRQVLRESVRVQQQRNKHTHIPTQSLIITPEFQHILRILNTNVDGTRSVQYALTAIKGVGRRFANVVCKKAEIDLNQRAGELTQEKLEEVIAIVSNPKAFKIPDWFLNRQRDWKTNKPSQATSNVVDTKLREDLERLKKIRSHRGIRHYWGVRVRGQHTKTTGRRGKTVGPAGKK